MKVLVIGSINTDFVVESNILPELGETVFGQDFAMLSGGKGANQAVAAARLGANVSMIAAMGDDEMGRRETKLLKQENIDTSGIHIKIGVPTGVAVVNVSQGDNCIIVVSGANAALTVDDIREQQDKILAADVILCSLEIPLACVEYANQQAYKYGKKFILNPAPAPHDLPDELVALPTLVTPNLIEYAQIFGLPEHCQAADVVHHFKQYSQENMLVTCGRHGVLYHHHSYAQRQSGFKVNTLDSTGAGDTFNGALAAFFDMPRREAVRHATAAAALSVTRKGARNGMPFIEELKRFMQEYQ